MSDTENSKPGCLAAIFGFLLLFYTIYTPVYFLILNDEVDAVQEASLLDFLFTPPKLMLEAANTKGNLNELDRLIENCRDDVKKNMNIDIGQSFEDALADNTRITRVNFYEAGNHGSAARVITEFDIQDVGRVKMVRLVVPRSFFKVGLTQFVKIDTLSLNNEWVSNPEVFIAKYVYGINNEKTLKAMSDMLRQIPR